MRISLVTTVKDEARSARRLIDAVAAQSRPPDEWIVVDGGSVDGTPLRFVEAPGCRVIRASCNIAAGRNLAIEASGSPIVAVTDGGCAPQRRWLERLVAPIEAGAAEIAAGATRPCIRRPFDAVQWTLLDQFAGELTGRAPAISARSLAFVRQVWEGQPFPEWLPYGEDAWVMRRWRRQGKRLERVPAAVVEWELPPGWPAFMRQHFRYMWGDGRAGLNPWRHAGRFVFYGALAALALVGGTGTVAAGALLGGYAGATAIRLPQATSARGRRFRAAVLLLLVPCLLSMDVAKMGGFLAGACRRLTGRSPG